MAKFDWQVHPSLRLWWWIFVLLSPISIIRISRNHRAKQYNELHEAIAFNILVPFLKSCNWHGQYDTDMFVTLYSHTTKLSRYLLLISRLSPIFTLGVFPLTCPVCSPGPPSAHPLPLFALCSWCWWPTVTAVTARYSPPLMINLYRHTGNRIGVSWHNNEFLQSINSIHSTLYTPETRLKPLLVN